MLIIEDATETHACKHADSFRTRHITETFLRMYSASARSAAPNMRGTVLIATAQSQATIHPLLKTLHVFDETINVLPPNKDARRDVSETTFVPVYLLMS
jgi:peroxin-1